MNKKKIQEMADKQWALAVKQRDNFACIVCGATEKLNAHHIIDRSIKCFRHDINNGLSLCPKHHKFSRKFSAHKNSFMFYEWFANSRSEQYLNLLASIDIKQAEGVFD